MIKLTIDDKVVEVAPGATILVAAKSVGIAIPTLCYLESCGSTGSCMVCAVQNSENSRMLPACAARCEAGMKISTSSSAVIEFRRGVIELLLNEHRGDCLAPCQLACPYGLDISTMLHLLVQTKHKEAAELLFRSIPDPQQTCPDCRGGCELACRRGRHDKPIAIRQIIADLSTQNVGVPHLMGADLRAAKCNSTYKTYNHHFGLVTKEDMAILLEGKNANDDTGEAARCLRCDCRAVNDCQLRQLAAEYDAEQQRFGKSSVKFDRVYYGEVGYEVGKCVKCGNCIAVGERLKPGQGPVFSDRGARLTVSAPFGIDKDKLFDNIADECIKVCPTGALFRD
ncbi:MAG: 2Fe-2S iron-sulfur cluster-binding protein [Victivallaceae bacterium]|nr:2Fe-2S iron-sulfur cluster-binding protein [Victivallaceae bacterium]